MVNGEIYLSVLPIGSISRFNISLGTWYNRACLLLRPLQIQRQQLLQNLLIAQITLPPICRKDCFIEPLVGEIVPGGTDVGPAREQKNSKPQKYYESILRSFFILC